MTKEESVSKARKSMTKLYDDAVASIKKVMKKVEANND